MNILHFTDPLGDLEEETVMFMHQVDGFLKDSDNIYHTDDFDDVMDLYKYDIVFFDYGGLGYGCASLLEDYERVFSREIKNNPNTLFCLISNIPSNYINEDMREKHSNLFIGFEALPKIIQLV